MRRAARASTAAPRRGRLAGRHGLLRDAGRKQHPLREGVRDNTNHYVTGRDGGRDIDLRRFALEGMELLGTLSASAAASGCASRPTARQPQLGGPRLQRPQRGDRQARIEKAGLAAPAGSVYRPAWQPSAERRAREPAPARSGHHVGAVVHRLRCRLRLDRRAGVRPARAALSPARRHRVSRTLFQRAAVAPHLGLGALCRCRTRCASTLPSRSRRTRHRWARRRAGPVRWSPVV